MEALHPEDKYHLQIESVDGLVKEIRDIAEAIYKEGHKERTPQGSNEVADNFRSPLSSQNQFFQPPSTTHYREAPKPDPASFPRPSAKTEEISKGLSSLHSKVDAALRNGYKYKQEPVTTDAASENSLPVTNSRPSMQSYSREIINTVSQLPTSREDPSRYGYGVTGLSRASPTPQSAYNSVPVFNQVKEIEKPRIMPEMVEKENYHSVPSSTTVPVPVTMGFKAPVVDTFPNKFSTSTGPASAKTLPGTGYIRLSELPKAASPLEIRSANNISRPTTSNLVGPSLSASDLQPSAYDRSKLDNIIAGIKQKSGLQPSNSIQTLQVPTPGKVQNSSQPVMYQQRVSSNGRPLELVNIQLDPMRNGGYPNDPHMPRMNNYDSMPMIRPNLVLAPQGFVQNNLQYYESAPHQMMVSPSHHMQSPQYASSVQSHHSGSHSDFYGEARNEDMNQRRYFEAANFAYPNSPQEYVPAVREGHNKARGHHEKKERGNNNKQSSRKENYERQEMNSPPQEEDFGYNTWTSQGGKRGNGEAKRKTNKKEKARKPKGEQNGDFFFGRIENDEDSLVIKHHEETEKPEKRKKHRQEIEDDSKGEDNNEEVQEKPKPKNQEFSHRPRRRERSRMRAQKKEQAAAAGEALEDKDVEKKLFTTPQEESLPNDIPKGPQALQRARRGARSRSRRVVTGTQEEQNNNKNTEGQAGDLINVQKKPAQAFGQEYRKGGSVPRRVSQERAHKREDSNEFQLKGNSAHKGSEMVFKGNEVSDSNEDRGELFDDEENEGDFEVEEHQGKSGSPEERGRRKRVGVQAKQEDDSVTRAFEYAKYESPEKRSPNPRVVKETKAKKTEMIFKNSGSRRKIMK